MIGGNKKGIGCGIGSIGLGIFFAKFDWRFLAN